MSSPPLPSLALPPSLLVPPGDPLNFPSLDPNTLRDDSEENDDDDDLSAPPPLTVHSVATPTPSPPPEPQPAAAVAGSLLSPSPPLPSSSSCPLCCYKRRRFVCTTCVRDGKFFHSDPSKRPEFADDKFARWERCREIVRECTEKIEAANSPSERLAALKEKIKHTKSSIRMVNRAVTDKAAKAKMAKHRLDKLTRENGQRRHGLPIFKGQATRMHDATVNHKRELEAKRVKAATRLELLALERKDRVREFARIVFPMADVPSVAEKLQRSRAEATLEDLEVIDTLEEAMDTSFIDGHWISTKDEPSKLSRNPEQIQIVASAMPKSGDYSQFHLMDYARRDGGDEYMPLTARHAIHSGLMHVTHLLTHLASTLDVQLPRRCALPTLADWTSAERALTEHKFARMVARINMAVVYICVAMRIPPERVSWTVQTLVNLRMLMEAENDGFGQSFQHIRHIEFLHAKGLDQTECLKSIARTQLDCSDDDEDEELLGHGAPLGQGWMSISEEELYHIPEAAQQQQWCPRSPSPAVKAVPSVSTPTSTASSVLTSMSSVFWPFGQAATSPKK